jgi:hypothetical protein
MSQAGGTQFQKAPLRRNAGSEGKRRIGGLSTAAATFLIRSPPR